MIKRIILGVLLAVGPTLVFAECTGDQAWPSSTQSYKCNITTSCTSDGICSASSETVSVTLTGLNTCRHGEGTYELTIGETTTEAENLTPYGPFMWADANTLFTLTSLGARRDDQGESAVEFMSLSSVTIDEPPTGTVKFLHCKGPT
jgi:hypothetical protein